jgi:hypothetical protein
MGSYAEMKKANPDFPILVREASGTEAKLIARYGEFVRVCCGWAGLVGLHSPHTRQRGWQP